MIQVAHWTGQVPSKKTKVAPDTQRRTLTDLLPTVLQRIWVLDLPYPEGFWTYILNTNLWTRQGWRYLPFLLMKWVTDQPEWESRIRERIRICKRKCDPIRWALHLKWRGHCTLGLYCSAVYLFYLIITSYKMLSREPATLLNNADKQHRDHGLGSGARTKGCLPLAGTYLTGPQSHISSFLPHFRLNHPFPILRLAHLQQDRWRRPSALPACGWSTILESGRWG